MALWAIGILSFSSGLFYLLQFIEAHYETSLAGFALHAYLLVFAITLLSSATIVLPVPVGTVLVIAAGATWNPAIVAIVASIGGTIGELSGYYAGYLGRKVVVKEQRAGLDRATRLMNKYGIWAVSFIAMIPVILFDIVGLVAGALKLPVWKFLLACWIGRLPRSFFEVYGGGELLRLLLS